jgi:hypothetical protein
LGIKLQIPFFSTSEEEDFELLDEFEKPIVFKPVNDNDHKSFMEKIAKLLKENENTIGFTKN